MSDSSGSDSDDNGWVPFVAPSESIASSQMSKSRGKVIDLTMDLTNDVSQPRATAIKRPASAVSTSSSTTFKPSTSSSSTSGFKPYSNISDKKSPMAKTELVKKSTSDSFASMFDDLVNEQQSLQKDAAKAAERSALSQEPKFYPKPPVGRKNRDVAVNPTSSSSDAAFVPSTSIAPVSRNYDAPKAVPTIQKRSASPFDRAASPQLSVQRAHPISQIQHTNADPNKQSKRPKTAQQPSEESIAEAFRLFDDLRQSETVDWQERFLHTILSWDLNILHQDSQAGPPLPPFSSLVASNQTTPGGPISESDERKLLTDPASYVKFASEKEYTMFFEFLLMEDFKARVVGVLVDKRNTMTARLARYHTPKQSNFIDLFVFVSENDAKNISTHDLMLLELDPTASLTSSSIVHHVHVLAVVQSVDSVSEKRRQVRFRIFPVNDKTHTFAARHSSRFYRSFSVLNRLTPVSTTSGSNVELSIKITPLESTITTMREYLALHALSDHQMSHKTGSTASVDDGVRSDILMPGLRPKLAKVSHKHSVVATLPPALSNHLKSDMNESQLAAIQAACLKDASPFVLLQGPPGTGKTKVVIKILNVLHLHFYLLHYDSLVRSLSSRIQQSLSSNGSRSSMWSGKTLDLIWTELKNITGMSPKPRILVCAPSNAAVDEIVERLQLLKLLDGDLNKYDAEMVRVGNADRIRDAVNAQLSLDSQVDAFLTMSPDALTIAKTAARKELNAVQLDLNRMEEYARTHYNELFSEHADVNTRMAFSADLVRAYDTLNRQKVVLDRCNICSDAGADKSSAREKLQLSILNSAQIVFTTLSGAGTRALTELERGFDRCIIDEAGQCVELSILIPLRLRVQSCILVGDPRQLPATCFLNGPIAKLYERSLFERFEQAGYPVHMLQTQYRMHPEICAFPSAHFYQNKLQNAESVSGPSHAAFFHQDPRFAPYLVFDIEGQEQLSGHSMSNAVEAKFVAEHLAALLRAVPPDRRAQLAAQIGVITPYHQQRMELIRAIGAILPAELTSAIDVATVDSFQGREKDVIVISCVRALTEHSGGIGFVADRRRLNVAVTRARLALWIVGDSRALDRSPDWRALIDDSIGRKIYRRTADGAGKQGMSRRERDYWLKQEKGHQNYAYQPMQLTAATPFALPQSSNPMPFVDPNALMAARLAQLTPGMPAGYQPSMQHPSMQQPFQHLLPGHAAGVPTHPQYHPHLQPPVQQQHHHHGHHAQMMPSQQYAMPQQPFQPMAHPPVQQYQQPQQHEQRYQHPQPLQQQQQYQPQHHQQQHQQHHRHHQRR